MNLGMRLGSIFFGIIASVYGLTAVSVLGFLAYSFIATPRPEAVQRGYRGTGLFLFYDKRELAKKMEANAIPPSVPYAGNEGAKAETVYKNIKVLGDVPVGEFTRLMVSMARWVAPTQGCAACHNVNDFADDSLYTKVVARRMLQMTRHINTDWTKHVAETGVTCYTCHRGQLVPPNVWFNDPGPKQIHPSDIAAGTALPSDALTAFLEQSGEIRLASTTPLPTGNRTSIKHAEWTYSLMLTFSKSLGVNCDFCHNTRSFYSWAISPPQRVTAWYGIRMVRDLNNSYLDPLRDTFPASHRGPVMGDAPKVYCATCHNGVYKPLFGVSMAKDYPELKITPERSAQQIFAPSQP